jgi:hypothetical protein
LEEIQLDRVQTLIGKMIASNITESVELRILQQRLIALLENFTQDDICIMKFNEILNIILVQAQTDSKFEGFVAGVEWADIQ